MKNWFALLCALPLVAVAAPERIVALGGDVTEIVYALGAESSLVARDSTSQWPQATKALPDVGYLRQLNAEEFCLYARRWCWQATGRNPLWR